MRIHHLQVTAFGPFAGSQVVDFDRLSAGGLFLLCGPTGAGKTSVLDAICFGLYGEVPGDRNSAKRLRSDHAAAGVAPAVLLEVSINARRFRISRSPAWQRPKRRGEGTVTEHAKVNLEELVADTWVHHSNRLDETGHLMTELLGMNVTQFCQVALLPQGKFQSFLRARSDERHQVLQQLFRTNRFEDMEKWLVARRKVLKEANRTHHQAVASVVSRVSEAATCDLPDAWDLHDLTGLAEDGSIGNWASDLETLESAARSAAEADLRSASERAEHARLRLREAHRVLDLQAKHAEARRTRQSLEATSDEAEDARSQLESARRAAVVAPLLQLAVEATLTIRSAESRLGDVLADAAGRLGADAQALTQDDLATAERDSLVLATTAQTLLPREAELRAARAVVDSTSAALVQLQRTASDLKARAEELPEEIGRTRSAMAEQAAVARGLPAVEDTERALLGQLGAAEKLESLNDQLGSVREQYQRSVDTAQSLRERLQDVREARINGMAAELAAVLAVGGSCPVCGSADHPSLALATEGAPTKGDEELARTACVDADFARQAHEEVLRSLQQNCALAANSAGNKTVKTLRGELDALHDQRLACQRADAARVRLESTLEALTHELADIRLRAGAVAVEIARLTEQRDHAQAVIDRVSAELAAILGDDDFVGSISQLIDAQSDAGRAFARARKALAERDEAVRQSRDRDSAAQQCAQQHGFDDCETAAAALLSREELESLEALLSARQALQVAATNVLTDNEVLAAADGSAPDLAELTTVVRATEAANVSAGAAASESTKRALRLESLHSELVYELDAWAPTRSMFTVVQSVSTFVEGKGGDNALQMRLSAYVLAARLQQVVDAANERLSTMSDQRYSLEHSPTRGVGEMRGGLSLLVRDEWTGTSRDPATLSGGETFVASLALALGLADVVTQEAGGSNIDTLFIDEGFGSLDPETLDDVMDTLDALRDGGRVVGIVSHVPEMRSRVPFQLQISKERSGSAVAACREVA